MIRRCDRFEMNTLSVLRHKKIKFSYHFGEIKRLIRIKASRYRRESPISFTASINFSFHFHFVSSLTNIYKTLFMRLLYSWNVFPHMSGVSLSFATVYLLLSGRNPNLKSEAIYSYTQLVHNDSPGLKASGNLVSTGPFLEFRFMFWLRFSH